MGNCGSAKATQAARPCPKETKATGTLLAATKDEKKVVEPESATAITESKAATAGGSLAEADVMVKHDDASATKIQAAYRGHTARRASAAGAEAEVMAKRHASATKIQATYRGKTARRASAAVAAEGLPVETEETKLVITSTSAEERPLGCNLFCTNW
jgi:hypothetical protein